MKKFKNNTISNSANIDKRLDNCGLCTLFRTGVVLKWAAGGCISCSGRLHIGRCCDSMPKQGNTVAHERNLAGVARRVFNGFATAMHGYIIETP
ncbi:MAG: hypothetical protein GXY32_11165 [Ruminococcaceae bacterium]|nr:hypothetical protein [Oscillospiraceae bacterium]